MLTERGLGALRGGSSSKCRARRGSSGFDVARPLVAAADGAAIAATRFDPVSSPDRARAARPVATRATVAAGEGHSRAASGPAPCCEEHCARAQCRPPTLPQSAKPQATAAESGLRRSRHRPAWPTRGPQYRVAIRSRRRRWKMSRRCRARRAFVRSPCRACVRPRALVSTQQSASPLLNAEQSASPLASTQQSASPLASTQQSASPLVGVQPSPSLRQQDPLRQSGYFPAASAGESALFQALNDGSLEAGVELVKELENRTSRTPGFGDGLPARRALGPR